MDQVPLAFDLQQKGKSWFGPQEKRERRNAGAGSGMDKRFCTIHVAVSCDLSVVQPFPLILFRGAGKITQEEREAWAPGVHVLFQKATFTRREESLVFLINFLKALFGGLPAKGRQLPFVGETSKRKQPFLKRAFFQVSLARLPGSMPRSPTSLWTQCGHRT